MKQHTLILIFTLIIQMSSMSQSCLPEGIIFATQAEIDDFQTNYPGCSIIEGNVKINGEGISNLNGLNVLSGIYGGLWIRSNNLLTGLQGLENLNTIGGYLRIVGNDTLTNLDGLDNLDSIGDYLCILSNANLNSLEALGNLTHVGGEIEIVNNSSLTSLTGLDNIDQTSLTNIGIYLNSALSDCEVQSICSYLQNPNGIVSIYNNAGGCDNPAEITNSCGFTLECLPYGNYYMFSQAEVDNFDNNYLNCTELNGDVIVEGDDITSLTGLNNITSIGGDLVIGRPLSGGVNPLLSDLSGLDMLGIIHGSLKIVSNENLLSISGLGDLDSIGGNLEVISNHDLSSLTGLDNLTHIAAAIRIEGNDDLPNLTGLESITSIDGYLSIFNNNNMSDLTGLNNLEEVGGDVELWGNDNLSNLSGLDNLARIGGDLKITSSDGLTNLSGLDMLDSISGSMIFEFNSNLNSFSGLDELSSIQGDLSILRNYNLSSLSGLDNISPGSINNLSILGNNSLSNCDVISICDYLSSPGGSVNIYDNAPGCDSPPEIASACGFTLSCLPYGNYYIQSQADVDEFFIVYPDCFELNGNANISGENITDLSGLNGITSIEKNLSVNGNFSLIDFEGLSSLNSIGGGFYLGHYVGGNPLIQSFSGLEGLTRIGGTFQILYNYVLIDFSGLNNLQSVGDIYILNNESLESLTGLENLDSINGNFSIKGTNILDDISQLSNLTYVDGTIYISYNEALSSLSGLENIESDSIDHLFITNNTVLAHCDVISVCNYLSDTNNYVLISDNAPGCNSQEEVEFACTLEIPEEKIWEGVILYPNPATNTIFISSELSTSIEEINIYNLLGQKVLYKSGETSKIDVSSLSKGLYIIELVTNKLKIRVKTIVK